MTKMRKFANAYSAFKDIDDEKALKKNGLSLSDYYALLDVLRSMSDCKTSGHTICMNVANWCAKKGFSVKPYGIGYEISID